MASKDSPTLAKWLTLWLSGFDSSELGYGAHRRLLKYAQSLGTFGARPISELGAAEVYRYVHSLPKADRERAYFLFRRALKAAKAVGLETSYPGFPAKRVIAKTAWLGVRFVLVAGVIAGAITSGFAADRMIRFKEDSLTAYATVLRESGFGVVVAFAEDIYYNYINTPKIGGEPSSSADFGGAASATPTPSASGASVAYVGAWGAAQAPSPLPTALVSPVTPKPGEGQWQDTEITVNGSVAVRIARIRPDTEHTSYYATIAWFDPKLLAFMQVPGTNVPEGKFYRGDGMVPAGLRQYYMAGLNDAFLMRDSQGGYQYGDTVVKKLKKGKATLVTYTDGSIDVLKWGRDLPTKPIQAARQNLTLMVDSGISMVRDENQAKWGWVWEGIGSGKNLVWRSAIGVRADGTIVYCIGPVLSAGSLADMMIRAGAVKAMPLDMNSAYANGFLYGPYAPGKRIDPNIFRGPERFWEPSERDFVAVFAKSP